MSKQDDFDAAMTPVVAVVVVVTLILGIMRTADDVTCDGVEQCVHAIEVLLNESTEKKR